MKLISNHPQKCGTIGPNLLRAWVGPETLGGFCDNITVKYINAQKIIRNNGFEIWI